MEKGKIEKEGKINLSTLALFTVIYLAVLILYAKITDLGSNRG